MNNFISVNYFISFETPFFSFSSGKRVLPKTPKRQNRTVKVAARIGAFVEELSAIDLKSKPIDEADGTKKYNLFFQFFSSPPFMHYGIDLK